MTSKIIATFILCAALSPLNASSCEELVEINPRANQRMQPLLPIENKEQFLEVFKSLTPQEQQEIFEQHKSVRLALRIFKSAVLAKLEKAMNRDDAPNYKGQENYVWAMYY